MGIQRLTNDSEPHNSPHVHHDDDNHLVVSGVEVEDPEIDLDDQERAVRIPAVLVIDAVAQLGGELVWDDVERMFESFARSAFRVETLPFYAEESNLDALEHFVATGELIQFDELEDWLRLLADHRAAGRSIRRVHTVRLPLTEYLRWELTSQSQDDREETRVLDLGEYPELAEVEELGDAWIFDDRVGARLCYDDDAAFTHVERLADDELRAYRSWRERAWKAAVPVGDFMADVG